MRLEIAYILLALFLVAMTTGLVLFVRYRQREHIRVWGRRSRQRR